MIAMLRGDREVNAISHATTGRQSEGVLELTLESEFELRSDSPATSP